MDMTELKERTDQAYMERFMRERTKLSNRLVRGEPRGELLSELQSKFERITISEEEEDLLIDLMDCLTGYCAPHMKL